MVTLERVATREPALAENSCHLEPPLGECAKPGRRRPPEPTIPSRNWASPPTRTWAALPPAPSRGPGLGRHRAANSHLPHQPLAAAVTVCWFSAPAAPQSSGASQVSSVGTQRSAPAAARCPPNPPEGRCKPRKAHSPPLRSASSRRFPSLAAPTPSGSGETPASSQRLGPLPGRVQPPRPTAQHRRDGNTQVYRRESGTGGEAPPRATQPGSGESWDLLRGSPVRKVPGDVASRPHLAGSWFQRLSRRR